MAAGKKSNFFMFVMMIALSLCPPSAYLVVFVLYIIQKKWREKRKDEYGGSYFIFLVLTLSGIESVLRIS